MGLLGARAEGLDLVERNAVDVLDGVTVVLDHDGLLLAGWVVGLLYPL